jgi:hypothetical protein
MNPIGDPNRNPCHGALHALTGTPTDGRRPQRRRSPGSASAAQASPWDSLGMYTRRVCPPPSPSLDSDPERSTRTRPPTACRTVPGRWGGRPRRGARPGADAAPGPGPGAESEADDRLGFDDVADERGSPRCPRPPLPAPRPPRPLASSRSHPINVVRGTAPLPSQDGAHPTRARPSHPFEHPHVPGRTTTPTPERTLGPSTPTGRRSTTHVTQRALMYDMRIVRTAARPASTTRDVVFV